MKKKLIAALCSAVIAISSLTGITVQAAEVATTTDTTATTDTVLTPVWDTVENLHIYGKSFSGTLLSLYTVAFSYQTNIRSNFTVTATDLFNNTANGYTVVKVTATRTPNESRYGKTSSGKITTDITDGVVHSVSENAFFVDSFGYYVYYDDTVYAYLDSISEVGDYHSSSNAWNKAKCFLEPYGYTYEYLKALATQMYPKNSTGHSNWLADYPNSSYSYWSYTDYNEWLGSYDFYMNKKINDLITSALDDIYGTHDTSICKTSLDNYVYMLNLNDGYNHIIAVPNSEKIYYMFNRSRKLDNDSNSYNSYDLISLN
jgi:hypothetical protein